MNPRERKALVLIAGCPNGITRDMLAKHDIGPGDLAGLVARGLIESREQSHSNPPGLVVTRYWATAAGKNIGRNEHELG
jgi:hypothetical protein